MILLEGYVYRDTTNGYKSEKEVVYKWISSDNQYAIVHEVGEPDMQSCYGVSKDLLTGPIRKANNKDLGIG